MISDLINCGFEAFASLAVYNHCRVIMRDKKVAGTSILSTAFFMAWGFWNMYYYPALGQNLSFFAGIGVCAMNCLYVYLLCKYRVDKPKVD